MKQNFLLFFVAALFFTSCKKEDAIVQIAVTEQALTDVSYGTDAKQKMDIYLPANRSTDSTKIMVVIHGGSWFSGDKWDMTATIDSLKKRLPDYAFFNINYRLSTGTANLFPTQELDVRSAVEFIASKASGYKVNINKLVIAGASAGAHLAMLQAYKDSVPVRAKAVVSFFGPTDLLDMYNNPANGDFTLSVLLAQVIGKTPAQDPAIYASSSPVNFIRSTSPPTILLHGGADVVVRYQQSIEVRDLLTTAGVTNQYVFYPTGGHADWDIPTYTDAFNKTVAFLKANVH